MTIDGPRRGKRVGSLLLQAVLSPLGTVYTSVHGLSMKKPRDLILVIPFPSSVPVLLLLLFPVPR